MPPSLTTPRRSLGKRSNCHFPFGFGNKDQRQTTSETDMKTRPEKGHNFMPAHEPKRSPCNPGKFGTKRQRNGGAQSMSAQPQGHVPSGPSPRPPWN